MNTVFEALDDTGATKRRTYQPIRRNSRERGRCEAGFWQPFKKGQTTDFMRAAEQYELMSRQKGQRRGALGPIGLEVLRDLLRLVDYRTGRLDPAISTLQKRLKRSRDAIVRALKALKAHGFLDWIRRFEPTGERGRAGPQVKQASNAYRLSLPTVAKRLLGWLGSPPPVPDDFEHRRKAAAQAIRDMEFTASGLEATFDRLYKLVMERESAKRSESSQTIYINAEQPGGCAF